MDDKEEIEVVELNEDEEKELKQQVDEEGEVEGDEEEIDDNLGDDEIEIIPNDAFVTLTHHTGTQQLYYIIHSAEPTFFMSNFLK